MSIGSGPSKLIWLLAAIALALVGVAKSAMAETGGKPGAIEPLAADSPAMLVRQIVMLQERIAYGDRVAHRRLSERLPKLSARLLAAPSEVWGDRRNRYAALKLVAVGGPPNLLREIYMDRELPADERRLAAGVMFNAMGRRNLALPQLQPIDHRSLPPSLAGTVALIKGLAASTESAPDAIAFMDEARLLSPGTIVEETALRMTIQLAAQAGDNPRATQAFFRYVRRYAQSVYFPTVVASVSRVLADAPGLDKQAGQIALSEALDKLDANLRIRVLGRMAVAAVRAGALDAARFASTTALNGALDLGPRRPLFEVYAAASDLLLGSYSRSVARLQTLQTAHMLELPRRERELVEAALVLAKVVRAPPIKLDAAEHERVAAAGLPDPASRELRDVPQDLRHEVRANAEHQADFVDQAARRLAAVKEQTEG